MVDANMGWDVATAIEASKRMAEFDLVWIEEPIVPEDVAGHVRIRAESRLGSPPAKTCMPSTNSK